MADRKTVKNEELFADVEQIIGCGGNVELRVKGHSMRPFLRNAMDTVCLVPVDTGSLKRGMVVLFRYQGRHLLHRISRVQGNKVEMKGDGNCRQAEYVTRNDIAAYADAIKRGKKFIRYGSLHWKTLTAWSLGVKAARTLYRCVLRVAGKKDDV